MTIEWVVRATISMVFFLVHVAIKRSKPKLDRKIEFAVDRITNNNGIFLIQYKEDKYKEHTQHIIPMSATLLKEYRNKKKYIGKIWYDFTPRKTTIRKACKYTSRIEDKRLNELLSKIKEKCTNQKIYLIHIGFIEIQREQRGRGYAKLLLSSLINKHALPNTIIILESIDSSLGNLFKYYEKILEDVKNEIKITRVEREERTYIIAEIKK